MKSFHLKKALSLLCAAIMAVSCLAGCSLTDGGTSPDISQAGDTGSDNSKVESGEVNPEISDVMPVIMIQTTDGAESDLRFIDEPIARHVAEDIASWTPDYKMPPEPYYVDCKVSVIDKGSTVTVENADAQVKVRGNWSTSYRKKPLRIKFNEKQNLLGLSGGNAFRNWILLAEYKDGSMLRNKTALDVANAILAEDGLYASDAELVTVFVNGDYRGIYLLVEQQEIKKGRVEGTSLKQDYPGTDIGYLLEMDGYFDSEDELHRFHVSYNDNAPLVPYDGDGGSGRTMRALPEAGDSVKNDVGFTIKSDINSKQQTEFIANFVENVYRIMYSAAYSDESYVFDERYSDIKKTDAITPREAVERVVDVNSLADMYIISELTCDADIYWSSFYMSADFGADGNKKLTFQAPWDFDSGLGNKSRCPNGKGYYAGNIVPDVNGDTDYGWNYDTINPWMAVLLYEDWFMDIVREKWTKAYDAGVFSDALTMIDRYTKDYADEFSRNYEKWNNILDSGDYVGELSPRARRCHNQMQAADYLAAWFGSRVEFLNGEWHN